MTAITTPAPEPPPRGPMTPVRPHAVSPERDGGLGRRRIVAAIAAAAVAGIVIGGMLAPATSAVTSRDPRLQSLQWMFDTALIHPGTDQAGESQAAPFASLTIEHIVIPYPRRGPVLASGRAVRPDGSTTPVAYELEVRRAGDAWTVRADRLPPAAAPSEGGGPAR